MVYSTVLRTDQKNNYGQNKIGSNYVPCGETNRSTLFRHKNIFSTAAAIRNAQQFF